METISALANSLGLTPDTLRYYERMGLLRPPERTHAGYRLYDSGAADRVRFIKAAQRAGLRLSDIKELLDVQDRGQCPCGHTAVMVDQRLAEVTAQIRQLSALRQRLADLKRRNEECMDATPGAWSCSVVLRQEGGER